MVERELKEAVAGVKALFPDLALNDDDRLETVLGEISDLLATPGERESQESADPMG